MAITSILVSNPESGGNTPYPRILVDPNGYWPNQFALSKWATSTKAASILTSSSGATITLPAVSGKTNYLTKIIIVSGLAFLAIDDSISISGIDASPVGVPLVQSTSNGMVIELEYPEPVPATNSNVAITLTIPALTGGAKTTAFVCGYLV